MTPTTTLSIAQVVQCTEAEGPGKRFAIWFQGCPLRCPGCCNPEYLPFSGGQAKSLDELISELDHTRVQANIEGITLLGGEPFAHAPAATALARATHNLNLSVMVFSGYTLEQLRAMHEPAVGELLTLTDILVDGPYLRDQPDTERRWIGSKNQRIHFLTNRYHYDEQWQQRNTLEIRVDRTGITINGFPATDAVGLWKGWKRKKPTPTSPDTRGTEPR